MGAMISERQRDRAEGLCQNAVNEEQKSKLVP